MRIGIDCRAMLGRGGIAQYTYNLVKNLLLEDRENHYVLFFETKISQKLKKIIEQKNCSVKYFPLKRCKFLPLIHSHFIVSQFLNKQRMDVYHSPTGSLPLGYRGQSIITIHDLAIYKHPEWFPLYQWFSKKVVVPYSLKRAGKIIAVSKNTKQDIIKIFHISPPKIKVIYEGGLSFPAKQEEWETKDYILFIGTLEPRKNLGRLIKAFGLYRKRYSKAREKLVIVGGEGWKFKPIYALVEELGLQKEIKFLGYVSEKRKIELLKQAKVFVFPSLYEGFGLPILEAMGLDVPVICANGSALNEIAGDAAFFVDPQNTHSILQGLVKVLSNKALRDNLRKKGLIRTQLFSWQKCVQETLEVYNEIGNT